MKKLIPLMLIALTLGACSSEKKDPNQQAFPMLEQARGLMMQKNYKAAQDTIASMRTLYPTAFEARHQGILVMDSIELLQTQDSLTVLDSVLQKESTKLDSIAQLNNRGRNSPYYAQKNKVFYLRQQVDELCAKIKFFMRKIEEDKKQNNSGNSL